MEFGGATKAEITDSGQDKTLSRAAAAKFAEKWSSATDEKQQSQAFWHAFFQDVLEIPDLQAAGIEFEKRVTSSKKGTTNFIDVFWKDTFLVEQKSAGKDLSLAETQAREYVVSLPPVLRPPIIILCDFARFRIVDILLNKSHEFLISDLPDNLDRIEAVIKHQTAAATNVQVEADQKAAQLMADLYIQLEKYGYEGHEASVFMVRILFCLFADDTRMWKTDIFGNLVRDSNPLGTDLGPRLANLFEILDTPKPERRGPQDPLLADFPYVNGGIFSEKLATINFNAAMRNALMNACMYDWSSINPTIFGALFQDIKSKDERRANGEHYTTEQNIDKTIKPLFIDELHKKLELAWDNEGKLKELQNDLGTYQILDPACGCGNFLITTYKRLRQLELDIILRIKQLDGTIGQTSLLDVAEDIHVKLEQLHGIEYVEWSAQIAKVAIYLTDHQENMKLETVLGVAANRFPLTHESNIVQGNALQIDWSEVCSITDKTVIVGNPPFLGSNWQTPEQKSDTARIWGDVAGSGVIDYVANWHLLAARKTKGTKARVAFVSTNSITQGEQPQILWSALYPLGVAIDFAHRTFVWESDASGKASVHCVIIGFSHNPKPQKRDLWEYPLNHVGEAKLVRATNINAYLLDAPEVLITSRRKPLQSTTQEMVNGSKPADGGFLSNLSPEEAEHIRTSDPIAAKYLRPIIGAQEMLNAKKRYCLWLVGADPSDIKSSKVLSSRVASVRQMRIESSDRATQADAARASEFQKIRQPEVEYLGVPRVSSGNREYVPMMLISPDVICSDAIQTIPSSDVSTFAILQSKLFSVWNEAVSGRLKSDFRVSAEITYNTFPFPNVSESDKEDLEVSGRAIIEIRDKYPQASLATLYDFVAMPPDLRKAHNANDKVVLALCGLKSTATDAEILSYLFEKYAELAKEIA